MDGHDSPQIGNNDIDYKPTKLLSAFLKRACAIVKFTFFLILVIVLVRMKGE